MEAQILTVHWHDGEHPVYSVDFQPGPRGTGSVRLATGGGDNNVRLWKLVPGEEKYKVEYLSTLSKHTQAVNVVRFDPTGQTLASAGDDGSVMIWRRADEIMKEFGAEEDDSLESWTVQHVCRSSSSEIYDIAWSPDSKYVITGSTDNATRIYDAAKGQQVAQISEHSHYVQGVTWDPLNQFIATQSADRSVHIYKLKETKDGSLNPCLMQKSSRADIVSKVVPVGASPSAQKSTMLYHTESLRSFFRRLTFSPDGSLLLAPSGIHKKLDADDKEEVSNTVYIYLRSGLNKAPVAHLPGLTKPALVISFSPVFYELDASCSNAFQLPHKMVYAVATVDSVLIFDTQHAEALGSVTSIHYSTLTDLAWDNSGESLVVSSADGFCTNLRFHGLFGNAVTVKIQSLHSMDPNTPSERSPMKEVNTAPKETPTKPGRKHEQQQQQIQQQIQQPHVPVLDLLRRQEKPKKRVAPILVKEP